MEMLIKKLLERRMKKNYPFFLQSNGFSPKLCDGVGLRSNKWRFQFAFLQVYDKGSELCTHS